MTALPNLAAPLVRGASGLSSGFRAAAWTTRAADAIIKLAQSPELRKQMGQAGKQRVLIGDYDWQQKVDHLIQIFIETIDGAKPRA